MVQNPQNTIMSRSRNYCFTSFEDDPPTLQDGIKYLCYGKERCPKSGKLHWQGYVEFSDAISLTGAKRRLASPAAHLERRKGTAVEARDYCKKEGEFKEFGTISRQGKRSDLEAVRAAITDGTGMRGVIESGVSYQCIRYAEKYLTYMEPMRETVPTVLWYWGPTGTGKTRAACAEAAERFPGDVYWTNGGVQWWDGYDAHKAVIFDDFRPEWCKLPFLLRLLDRYPMRIPYKGGFRAWTCDYIYITCPEPPSMCYLDTPEANAQLVRRITEIKEFK